jgi:hypothetical protein
VTRYVLDIASYQGSLRIADVVRAGFTGVNFKVSHGLGIKAVHPNIAALVAECRAAGLGISTFHFLTGEAPGRAQAEHAYAQLAALGLTTGTVHQADCESDATLPILREYLTTMHALLQRKVVVYTGDWWWEPKGWDVTDLTPYLWTAPKAGYLGTYPGDTSSHWAGFGGWPELTIMQYGVGPLTFPDETTGSIDVSMSAVRNPAHWTALTEGAAPMPMNPRTHPRGAPPDFTLPKPNPNPTYMTDALWWLVCMRMALEPQGRNGGTYANKPGYHNIGNNLNDAGAGASDTDHSIRYDFDRTGPWWKTKTAAHDWTFVDAQAGNYATINKYTKRLIDAMKSLTDLRPDAVYAYTLGQIDGDTVVEGWNERTDADETGDSSHLWHRHDSFRRNIVGDYWSMWKALTIDMGWTYAEWQQSLQEDDVVTAAEMDLIAQKVAIKLYTDYNNAASGLNKVGKALPWQYVGAGIPTGKSTLQVLAEIHANQVAVLTGLAALRSEEATRDNSLRAVVEAGEKAQADRDAAHVAAILTAVRESAQGPITEDMLMAVLRRVYGEAFDRAEEGQEPTDGTPRSGG